MKFDHHIYFKHENCVDVFFMVTTVSFDDDGRNAIIWGYWMVQGIFNYWCCSNLDRIKISPDQYDKWKSYTPKMTPIA